MCSLVALKAAIEGKKVWWVAPTYTQAMLGFREAVAVSLQMPFPIVNQPGAMQILCPSRGFIRFKSSEIPENLRGEGLDLLIMDEADFQPEVVWTEVLRPALADRKGAAIFISTPNIENGWFHKLWLLGQTGSDPETKSWQFSSYTNPYLDPAEIDRAKYDLPSIVFRREFMAEFVSSAGARVQRNWIKYEDAPPSGLKVVLGVDLAISAKTTADFTACVALGQDKTGNLHVLDVQRTRATFAEQLDFISAFADKWRPSVIGVEDVAYQKAMVQQLSLATKYTVKGIKPDKDKVSRFAPIEARYEHGQVYHLRGLSPTFETELLSFPVSEHDDQCDAMSIAWSALAQIRKPIGPFNAPSQISSSGIPLP